MEAKARLFGHSIHQMLIPFPLGVLGTSLAFDLIAAVTHRGPLFRTVWYMIAAGVVTGLVAAVFGLIDWLSIPSGTRAKRIGAMHGIGNVVLVLLFATSWFIRRGHVEDPGTLAIVLSAIATGMAVVTGWLGGELVDRLSVGVDEGAHLDAPSSLTHRSATSRTR